MSFLTYFRQSRNLAAPAPVRRRSFCSFFLGRQDALDDHLSSPHASKKQVKVNESPIQNKPQVETPVSPPKTSEKSEKSKRATSFTRNKKPKLERGFSDQSVLKLNKNPILGETKFEIY